MGLLSNLPNVLNFMRMFQGGADEMVNGDSSGNQTPPAKDWFDVLIEKVSRLPRLLLLFGTVALLVWPIWDPAGLTAWAQAVAQIPENAWLLIFLVMSSWVGSKLIRDYRTGGMMNYGGFNSFSSFSSYGGMGSGFSSGYDGRFSNVDRNTPLHPSDHNDRIAAWKSKAGASNAHP